jgi:hypothetical protein
MRTITTLQMPLSVAEIQGINARKANSAEVADELQIASIATTKKYSS